MSRNRSLANGLSLIVTVHSLEIKGIKDDGVDPLTDSIAAACDWIESVRHKGGKVLVHCVSPSKTRDVE